MSRNKYGMNSVGKDKPETEDDFGNNVHTVAPEAHVPSALRKWMEAVKRFKDEAFKEETGYTEDWRPKGIGKYAPKK